MIDVAKPQNWDQQQMAGWCFILFHGVNSLHIHINGAWEHHVLQVVQRGLKTEDPLQFQDDSTIIQKVKQKAF